MMLMTSNSERNEINVVMVPAPASKGKGNGDNGCGVGLGFFVDADTQDHLQGKEEHDQSTLPRQTIQYLPQNRLSKSSPANKNNHHDKCGYYCGLSRLDMPPPAHAW